MSLYELLLQTCMHQKGDQTKSCRGLVDTRQMVSFQFLFVINPTVYFTEMSSPCVESQHKTL